MARALLSFRVIDQLGNAQPSASVLILDEDGSSFGQTIYAAASGGSLLPNPLITDEIGLATGYVPTPQRALARVTVDGQTTDTVIDITPDPADIALGGHFFDVQAYGALGDGSTNDAVAIDAAVAACQTAGGGVVYFPRGRYLYSGAGIVNNPSINVNQPLLLRGDGESASQLIFSSLSNPEAIKLSSANAIGNFACQGSGVEDLYLEVPVTKDAISISNIEQWRVRHVSSAQSKTFLKISNTRFGRAEHLYIYNYRGSGITVNEGATGAVLEDTWFEDIQISGSVPTTGWGFEMVLGAAPTGNNGTFLKHVVINHSSFGGFLFSSTAASTANQLFPFMLGCVADSGDFTEPPFRFKNGRFVFAADCWAYCLLPGKAAVEFDQVAYGSWIGGSVTNGHGTVGGLGSIFDLKNGCTAMTIRPSQMIAAPGGTSVTGLNSSAGTAPTGVSFDSGYQENLAQMIAPGKLLSASDHQRAMSASHMYTSDVGGIFTEFALLDQGAAHGKYFRINSSNGGLEILNTAHSAVIALVANDGSLALNGGAAVTSLVASGNVTRKRTVSTSTAITSSEIVLSGGFGASRTVTSVAGGDDHFRFIANAAGAGTAASPTITVTFKDGAFANAPQATVVKFGSYQPTTPITWSTTTTTLTITFAGTPVAGEAYEFSVMLTGR